MQQGFLRSKFRDKQDNSHLCNTTMKHSLLTPLMQVINLFWSLRSKPQFHCHAQCYRGGSNKIVLPCGMHLRMHTWDFALTSKTIMYTYGGNNLDWVTCSLLSFFVVNRNIKTRSENYFNLKMTHGRNCS